MVSVQLCARHVDLMAGKMGYFSARHPAVSACHPWMGACPFLGFPNHFCRDGENPQPPPAGPAGLHPSSAAGSVPSPVVVSSTGECTQAPVRPLGALGPVHVAFSLHLLASSRPCCCLGVLR